MFLIPKEPGSSLPRVTGLASEGVQCGRRWHTCPQPGCTAHQEQRLGSGGEVGAAGASIFSWCPECYCLSIEAVGKVLELEPHPWSSEASLRLSYSVLLTCFAGVRSLGWDCQQLKHPCPGLLSTICLQYLVYPCGQHTSSFPASSRPSVLSIVPYQKGWQWLEHGARAAG